MSVPKPGCAGDGTVTCVGDSREMWARGGGSAMDPRPHQRPHPLLSSHANPQLISWKGHED